MGEPYGFVSSSPDLYFDKDRAPSYVVCLERKYLGKEGRGTAPQCQYLTLTEYDGKFVEATFFAYSQPFNSKAKPAQRQVPLAARLLRSFDQIVEVIS